MTQGVAWESQLHSASIHRITASNVGPLTVSPASKRRNTDSGIPIFSAVAR